MTIRIGKVNLPKQNFEHKTFKDDKKITKAIKDFERVLKALEPSNKIPNKLEF